MKNDQIETKETQVFVDTEVTEETPAPIAPHLETIGLVRMEMIVEQSEYGPTAFYNVQVSPKLPAGKYFMIINVLAQHLQD